MPRPLTALAFALMIGVAARAFGQVPTKLVASAPEPFDNFGMRVLVEGDTAIVGATGVDGTAGNGSVTVFERGAGGWVEASVLTPSSPEYYSDFGAALAAEDDRLVVGAPGSNAGSVYVFERSGGAWSQIARLVGSDVQQGDRFGASVALRGDTLLVGAPYEDDPVLFTPPNDQVGAVYVFERVAGVWAQTTKLDTKLRRPFARYGWSLAFEGDTALVGSPRDDAKGMEAGAVFVWVRSGGVWALQAKLYAPLAGSDQEFGFSVALDGDVFAAGAPWIDVPGAPDGGEVYAFERINGAFQHALTVANSAPVQDARFGSVLALSRDALVVSSPTDSTYADFGGRVELHLRAGAEWPELALDLLQGAKQASVGSHVAIDGGTLWIGSYGDSEGGTSAGAVWVLEDVLDGTLSASPSRVSLGQGGMQAFHVTGGQALSGNLHLLLGSITGISPGLPIGGGVLPLMPDPYLWFTLTMANSPPLVGSFGALDASGGANPVLVVPPGSNPAHAGTSVFHADVVLSATLVPVIITNAVAVELTP